MQQFNSLIWRDCETQYAANPLSYISVQDDYQVNVNLLLLAQFLDQQSHYLQLVQWETLASVVEDWDTKIVTPYRKLRRLAKSHLQPGEYQQMLDIELMMERKTQQMLLKKLNQFISDNINTVIDNNNESYNTDNYLCLFGIDANFFSELQNT